MSKNPIVNTPTTVVMKGNTEETVNLSREKYILLLERALGIKLRDKGLDITQILKNLLRNVIIVDKSFTEMMDDISLIQDYFSLYEEITIENIEVNDNNSLADYSEPKVIGKIELNYHNDIKD